MVCQQKKVEWECIIQNRLSGWPSPKSCEVVPGEWEGLSSTRFLSVFSVCLLHSIYKSCTSREQSDLFSSWAGEWTLTSPVLTIGYFKSNKRVGHDKEWGIKQIQKFKIQKVLEAIFSTCLHAWELNNKIYFHRNKSQHCMNLFQYVTALQSSVERLVGQNRERQLWNWGASICFPSTTRAAQLHSLPVLATSWLFPLG